MAILQEQTIWNGLAWGLAGGVLIGVSAALLMLLRGRIAGISGITGGVLSRTTPDKGWRVLFLLGLVLGGATLMWLSPDSIQAPTVAPWMVIVAGALVGVGVSLGNGCTSGHGVCGIGRFSSRSLVATTVFVGVGMVAASLIHGA